MVDVHKILKFATTFALSADTNVDSLLSDLWDGSPPGETVPVQPAQPQAGTMTTPTTSTTPQTPQTPSGPVQLSARSQAKISELQPPEFQEQVRQLLLKGLEAGLRPEIVEGYRSQERQNELYEQGRTKPGAIVTQTKSSMHTKRMAVDIAQLDEKGGITYNPKPPTFWDQMGAIGRSIGLNWGGDWSGFKDRPHFQYKPKTNA